MVRGTVVEASASLIETTLAADIGDADTPYEYGPSRGLDENYLQQIT